MVLDVQHVMHDPQHMTWLEDEMQRRRVTVYDLQAATQVKVLSTVYRWTSGKSLPKDEQVVGIARALGLPEAVVRAQMGLYVSPELLELAEVEWKSQGLEKAAKRTRDRHILDQLAEIGRQLDEAQDPLH